MGGGGEARRAWANMPAIERPNVSASGQEKPSRAATTAAHRVRTGALRAM